MDVLKRERLILIEKVRTAEKYCLESLNANTRASEIKKRITILESYFQCFLAVEKGLMKDVNFLSFSSEFDPVYFKVSGILQDALDERSPQTSFASTSSFVSNGNTDDLNNTITKLLQQQQIMLESSNSSKIYTIDVSKLNIEVFDGESYDKWVTFQDLFESLIHNNKALSDAQRLSALTRLLKEEPKRMISHLKISDANYKEAWDKLVARYNKPKYIVASYIKQFLDQPTVSQATARNIRNMADISDLTIRGLRSLNDDATKIDPWLIYMLLEKLDVETRQKWAAHSNKTDFPTISAFIDFLNTRSESLEAAHLVEMKQPSSTSTSNRLKVFQTKISPSCPQCKLPHSIYKCPVYKQLDADGRKNIVVRHNLCFNCLAPGHTTQSCFSRFKCHVCRQRHHSSLHSVSDHPSSSTVNSNSKDTNILQPNSSQSNSVPHYTTKSLNTYQTRIKDATENNILLPTALVTVNDHLGKPQLCRVLLDSGATACFITEACIQRLKLPRQCSKRSVSGLSSVNVGSTRGVISLNIQSRTSSETICIPTFIMKGLTSNLPTSALSVKDLDLIASLELADPKFHTPGRIDILIGAEFFFKIIKDGSIAETKNNLIARNSMFGWVVSGGTSSQDASENVHNYDEFQGFHLNVTNDEILQKFWEYEDVENVPALTNDQKECENHFLSTHDRDSNGRYVVRLPFNQTPAFSNSKPAAISRLFAMERRFEKNPQLRLDYVEFMKDYLALGHMEEIPVNENLKPDNKLFYLPHHAVIKESSSTTKLRVVFDGSCKTSAGQSLNDTLSAGSVVQRSLVAVLLNFRNHKVAFSADIAKMYRQIAVHKDDQDFQRIVWRNSPSEQIKHFRLTTVTYGTTSAPFMATRVLLQLANDYSCEFPKACDIIKKNFYVDDLMSGADSEEEAVVLRDQIINILQNGGFQLRKWKSNSPMLLDDLPASSLESQSVEIDPEVSSVKVLGLHWHPRTDSFSFKLTLGPCQQSTKRQLISESARIYDPLGWLSPSVILIKIIYQQLWLEKLDWDEPVPRIINKKWQSLRNSLIELEKVKIPRWLQISSQMIVELHGFCDASKSAYAAAIYCRVVENSSVRGIMLAAGKTRVAPLKQQSIARLELCGALLLSKLFVVVKSALNLENPVEYAWTDSTTVLAWLSSTSIKFPEYIINRTQKILETIPNANWRYVASEDNPADCASRGILPTALISHNLWWTGPPWLQHPSEQWPTLISSQGVSSIEEGNTIALVTNLEDENTESTDDPDDIIASIFKTKSSYSAILRIIGYFVKWRTLSVQSHCPYLTVGHLRESTLICIRWSQNQMFSKEINAIKNNRALSYRSSISSLCPFIDENNILRVRGRLQNSDLPYSAKYPAIIHRHQIFSIRLVEYLHSTHLHPSITLLTSIVRQNYWIVGARYLIKKVTNDCMSCRRQRAAQVQQQMGHLPSYRVQSTRAFKETGIDYAGPITIRQNRGKNGKTSQAYIAIFVCMATKAIHIELVSDLTTDTFLAALKRFVSRRGLPANIYSDNGTNFVGASKELLQLQRLAVNSINNELIQYFLSSKGIQWHFNPPSAPHFGGLWESGVKSVKGHLKRVIGTTKLTFEELCTLLCQVEGLLNSRPLMPLHNTDPNNFEVLTPGHFLTGDAIVAVPEPSYTHLNMSTLSRWQFLQNMIQGFWNSWRHDYLTSLQQRPKWRTASNHFKIDDIVLIREDNAPPSCWPMGRIIQLHPGGDQLLRVVTLRTTKGIMKRPIIKLCLLLSESPRESSNSSAAD